MLYFLLFQNLTFAVIVVDVFVEGVEERNYMHQSLSSQPYIQDACAKRCALLNKMRKQTRL